MVVWTCTSWVGSSPHARGLPSGRLRSTSQAGIIPACAGFTSSTCYEQAARPDHPRMRGVYPAAPAVSVAGSGSSPHARGLRLPEADAGPDVGIIPACAGFTLPRRTRRPCPGDHPRMRGVYAKKTLRTPRQAGSSPHARGLPVVATSSTSVSGIIPACAGFTRTDGSGPGTRADHPRMRGVYSLVIHVLREAGGSSPHARGLRPQGQGAVPYVGIIPACAGFTTQSTRSSPKQRDHPRMRGVYRVGAGRE